MKDTFKKLVNKFMLNFTSADTSMEDFRLEVRKMIGDLYAQAYNDGFNDGTELRESIKK